LDPFSPYEETECTSLALVRLQLDNSVRSCPTNYGSFLSCTRLAK
jgi:hypothetical protein